MSKLFLYRYWGANHGMQCTEVESLPITLQYLRNWVPELLPQSWFIKRESDGVVIAQSKGFKP